MPPDEDEDVDGEAVEPELPDAPTEGDADDEPSVESVEDDEPAGAAEVEEPEEADDDVSLKLSDDEEEDETVEGGSPAAADTGGGDEPDGSVCALAWSIVTMQEAKSKLMANKQELASRRILRNFTFFRPDILSLECTNSNLNDTNRKG